MNSCKRRIIDQDILKLYSNSNDEFPNANSNKKRLSQSLSNNSACINDCSGSERRDDLNFECHRAIQENNFGEDENEDITLISKGNISQTEEISKNIKRILSIRKGTLLEVRSINERLSRIESTENAPKVDVSGMLSDNLPCKSLQDIEHLENLEKEEEFKESFTVFLKNIGGRNAKDHTNRSLQKIKELQSIRILIDLALANSWLEYKNEASNLGVPQQHILDLLAFRQCVAEHLILTKKSPKRGKPSTEPSTDDLENTSRRNRYESRPVKDSRYDRHQHIAEYDKNKYNSRCKLEG
ncbi:hypothetical protein JTB14_036656 [Gonioctena quinquepunctata]|nr:hypothetical protein JTB14_036656 [Gonioctena quinquepunctata]